MWKKEWETGCWRRLDGQTRPLALVMNEGAETGISADPPLNPSSCRFTPASNIRPYDDDTVKESVQTYALYCNNWRNKSLLNDVFPLSQKVMTWSVFLGTPVSSHFVGLRSTATPSKNKFSSENEIFLSIFVLGGGFIFTRVTNEERSTLTVRCCHFPTIKHLVIRNLFSIYFSWFVSKREPFLAENLAYKRLHCAKKKNSKTGGEGGFISLLGNLAKS